MARDVLAWVRERVAPHGGTEAVLEASNQNPSSRTWVVSLREPPGERRVFIKQHGEPQMFLREVAALERLRPYSGADEESGVPELLAVDRDRRWIALGWVEGAAVGPVLRRAVSRFSPDRDFTEGCRVAFRIGRWVHRFEERTGNGEQAPFPREAVRRRVEELLEALVQRGTIPPETRWRDALTAHLDSLFRAMAPELPICFNHRDFWPDHILRCGDRIVVIDFGRCIEGPPGRDAAQFWLRLGDMAVGNPLVSKKRTAALQERFREGCPRFDPAAPHVKVYMLLARLEQLCGLVLQKQVTLAHRLRARYHVGLHVRSIRRTLKEGRP